MNLADVPEPLKRQAWRLLRPEGWPDTFEETMEHPIRAQLISLYAYHLSKAAATPKALMVTRPALERASRLMVPRLTVPRRKPNCTDNKRAAAGDRDD